MKMKGLSGKIEKPETMGKLPPNKKGFPVHSNSRRDLDGVDMFQWEIYAVRGMGYFDGYEMFRKNG